MITISFFITIFIVLLILVDFKSYNLIFGLLITIGTFLWIFSYLIEIFKIELGFWNWSTIADSAIILCFSILSPGFTLNIIKYIKNNSNLNRKKTIFKEYHIHEGFVGVLFVVIAILLWILRYFLIQYEIIRKKLRIFLAVDMITLFLFLFSGSFLIFRDRRDLFKLRFIKNRNITNQNSASTVFNPIFPDSVEFFKSPRILLYPFGIILGSISLNMFIHGTDFLIEEFFNLTHERIVIIGLILCFIAGGMIGIDWYRLFAKLYPELYCELEKVLYELKDLKKENQINK
ncbi:MAG: hypothetical protein ACFE9I_17115 [Candidatus Hermodarchaeota archaeon]